MVQITAEEFKNWDRFYRAHFINCLSGIKPVSLIATVDKKGKPNLAVFSNIVHLGADPALIGFINRPREAAPHTIRNIEETGFYTINHIHSQIMEKAHQSSAKYPDEINEFEATGLTPQFNGSFIAPYVEESKIKYGLQLKQVIPIEINGTYLVIGEVLEVLLQKNLLQKDGFINLHDAESMGSVGIDGYSSFRIPVRYEYARPFETIKRL
jgi:flavin reductase (DIM6/NTAB) family NADH-FMN oxidoreductase RutF